MLDFLSSLSEPVSNAIIFWLAMVGFVVVLYLVQVIRKL